MFLPFLIPQLYVVEDVIWFVFVWACIHVPSLPLVSFVWCITLTTVVILRSPSRSLPSLTEVLRDFRSKLVCLVGAFFLASKFFCSSVLPPSSDPHLIRYGCHVLSAITVRCVRSPPTVLTIFAPAYHALSP